MGVSADGKVKMLSHTVELIGRVRLMLLSASHEFAKSARIVYVG